MTEDLPTPSSKDFELLRQTRSNRVWRVVVVSALAASGILLIALVGTFIFRSQLGYSVPTQALSAQLIELGHRWSDDLVEQGDGYRQWFERHGTVSESELFDGLSGLIIESLLKSNSALVPDGELTFLGRTFIAIHTGIIRLLFFVIASVRLWLAVGLIALVSGLRSWRPYRGRDVLGQMGNGRVFYSGAYATLQELDEHGVPEQLVPGFACPKRAMLKDALSSEVWSVVCEYAADNPTNLELVRILVGNRETAPYVAPSGEESQLAAHCKSTDLVSNAAALLREALSIHRDYAAGSVNDRSQSDLLNQSDTELEYSQRMNSAFQRVLTSNMRATLGRIPAKEIATLTLAFECGKVLAHSFEGERWTRRSNFPHLSARAILHSLTEFPRDYSTESRNLIRRALVYAARRSPFAPIRLPVDLDLDTAALRQWAELLLASPHELPATTVELALFAIVREAYSAWQERFLDDACNNLSLWRERGFATRTELLFLPLSEILRILRETVDPEALELMRVLLASLEITQRDANKASVESEGGLPPIFSFDRVHAVPSNERIDSLAKLHRVSSSDIRDWLALRYILSSFGWLASRVGDYSVPETNVIFSVFQATPPLAGANPHGRLGRAGMVTLRGSKVRERLGSDWSSRFTFVERVTIAEDERDFEKLLQGIETHAPADELDSVYGVATTAGSTTPGE